MTLGTKIKEYRSKLGFSQEKIAELAGTSRQAVTKWESDQSVPCMENLITLAEIFGVNITELTNGENIDSDPADISAVFKGKIGAWWYVFIVGFNAFMAFIAYICYEDTVAFLTTIGIAVILLPLLLIITFINYIILHDGMLIIHFGFFKKHINCKDIIDIEKTKTQEAGMALSFDRLLITTVKSRYIISVKDREGFLNQIVKCNKKINVY
ncbi:MAG: PH domain-containing protein [Oscillospiraceae bacterium]|nr:PH domain-containing protein [Oscillospiraceae bacterium]